MVELLDRDFPQLHLRLGQSHLGLGRPDRATRSLQQALTQTPSSPEVHFILGELRRQQAASEAAFEHYQTVIRFDPNHGLAWLRTAEIFEQVGASKKAIQAYRRATRLLPANSTEYIQALAHLEKIEPKLPEAMATGWSELIRQMTGPILICIIAALFDAGLRPWWIPVTGWLALVLAPIGVFLFVSGSSLPRNPLLQMLVGKQGLTVKESRTMATIAGALLWLAAMALILLPINQAYPEVPAL
jgi:tetratricopeptide (TPR) repeat protein